MNNLNVLILDDDRLQQNLISRYLGDVYKLFPCYSYNQAELLLEENPEGFFKAFLIDLFLGEGKTGLEFIEGYLNPCKTIAISGYLTGEVVKQLINLGVFAAHQKPVELYSLFISLNSIIRCEE